MTTKQRAVLALLSGKFWVFKAEFEQTYSNKDY